MILGLSYGGEAGRGPAWLELCYGPTRAPGLGGLGTDALQDGGGVSVLTLHDQDDECSHHSQNHTQRVCSLL